MRHQTPAAAGTDEGRKLLKNVDQLQECLSDTWETNGDALEQLGVLIRWWKLVRRALAISSIFSVLRERKRKNGKKRTGKSLKESYDVEVAKIAKAAPGARLYKYRHARTYADLGDFLADHPVLINQTVVVTLFEWKARVTFEGEERADVADVEEDENESPKKKTKKQTEGQKKYLMDFVGGALH